MRGIRERRYLTEKYQNKQVRLAYIFSYSKPHDTERYGRTKFAKKSRFWDILRGNYVEFDNDWEYDVMLSGWTTQHTFTDEELGRFRNHSWRDCGRPKCPGCSNPRRGYGWYGHEYDRITMQERISLMHLKEEIDFYRDLNNKGEGK